MKGFDVQRTSTFRHPTRARPALPDLQQPPGGWDPPLVLVVDDNPANLAAFEATLSEPGFELVIAQSGADAMRELLTGTFAVILLDINMPHLDGLETARLIRSRDRCKDIPIILVTAHSPDQAQLLRGYECGAVDYLVKPLLPDVLRYKVRVFVDLFRKNQQVAFQAAQLRTVNVQLQQEMNQRREAERDAAFEREERQRVAMNAIGDAVVTLDTYGNVMSLNAQAEQLLGRRQEEVRGLALTEALARESAAFARDLIETAAQVCARATTARSAAPAPVHAGAAGSRYVEYVISPVQDRRATVVGAVLILQDVTDRHTAELEREQALTREQSARQAAEEANHARDEFLSVISHELHTPLNAIVGWAQILQLGPADAQVTGRAVAAIHRSAMAQKKLIEDLLDMSRIINRKIDLNRASCDLARIVQSAAETVLPLAQEKSLVLECGVPEAQFPIYADESRIQQVLWNLLTNAVKFTPSSGRIILRLDTDGDRARVSVSDSGEGIEPAFLTHVFEAFRQADSSTARAHGGLGLGLAISRTLIAMHGGQIEAASDGPGTGASFTLWLPLAQRALAANEDTHPPVPGELSLHNRRVLIVDDDASTLEMVGVVIGERGAEVRCAGSAREALAIVRDWDPHIMLSDISMPGEDGYSLISRIRGMAASDRPRMPAIAVTAMASKEDRAAALDAGFDAHLVKPIEFRNLIQLISRLLKKDAHA